MSLAVYGKESLDELETMVVSKFSGIVNKNVEAPRWNDAPFLADQQASKVSIVPVKDSRSLTISFPTGDLEKHYKSSVNLFVHLSLRKLSLICFIAARTISKSFARSRGQGKYLVGIEKQGMVQ